MTDGTRHNRNTSIFSNSNSNTGLWQLVEVRLVKQPALHNNKRNETFESCIVSNAAVCRSTFFPIILCAARAFVFGLGWGNCCVVLYFKQTFPGVYHGRVFCGIRFGLFHQNKFYFFLIFQRIFVWKKFCRNCECRRIDIQEEIEHFYTTVTGPSKPGGKGGGWHRW